MLNEKIIQHVSESKSDKGISPKLVQDLYSLSKTESKAAFAKDISALNDELHKQGLLPGFEITGLEGNGADQHITVLGPDGKVGSLYLNGTKELDSTERRNDFTKNVLSDKGTMEKITDEDGNIDKTKLDKYIADLRALKNPAQTDDTIKALDLVSSEFNKLSTDGKTVNPDLLARSAGIELVSTYESKFNLMKYVNQDPKFKSALEASNPLTDASLKQLQTDFGDTPERFDVLQQLRDSLGVLTPDGKLDFATFENSVNQPLYTLTSEGIASQEKFSASDLKKVIDNESDPTKKSHLKQIYSVVVANNFDGITSVEDLIELLHGDVKPASGPY